MLPAVLVRLCLAAELRGRDFSQLVCVWGLNAPLSSLHSPFLPFLPSHFFSLPNLSSILPLPLPPHFSYSAPPPLYPLLPSPSSSQPCTFRHLVPEGKCPKPRKILVLCGATWLSYEVPGTHTTSPCRGDWRYFLKSLSSVD